MTTNTATVNESEEDTRLDKIESRLGNLEETLQQLLASLKVNEELADLKVSNALHGMFKLLTHELGEETQQRRIDAIHRQLGYVISTVDPTELDEDTMKCVRTQVEETTVYKFSKALDEDCTEYTNNGLEQYFIARSDLFDNTNEIYFKIGKV